MDPIENEPAAATQPAAMSTDRKIILGLAAALVVVVIGMYGWKAAAVSAAEDKLVEMGVQHAEARSQLIVQAKQLDGRRTEEALHLFSTPFAWAVRRELMVANRDQIDQYFSELVQAKGFESAILAQPDGKVVVASDRKNLAATFSSLYPANYLDAKEIMLQPASNGSLHAIIPILGLNQRLGTVVLEYTAPAYPLQ